MASEEHKSLSGYIKDVHLTLRKSTLKIGAESAWQEHCASADTLVKYAQCMKTLATTHWDSNCTSETNEAKSRIEWVVEYCDYYFIKNNYQKYREREITISQKLNVNIETEESFSEPIKLIDVGSCYNPFMKYEMFDVFAIDLCPANASVLQCDFLNVKIGSDNVVEGQKVVELKENFFDVVTFCFLLEYIPSSNLRIVACEKAYSIVQPGGLLIINTPDSKHVGANSKQIKCWRYTLAQIGFNRIKYEKTKYMHCMAFRKTLNKEIANRWAFMYKEPYMKYAIHIPQDFNTSEDVYTEPINIPNVSVANDFKELPFAIEEYS